MTKAKKLKLWAVEVKDDDGNWTNCVGVKLTKKDAKEEQKYWCTQFSKTRVRKYVPAK